MSEQDVVSTIARDSVRTFAVNVVTTFISVITGIIVAKVLGPEAKGEFSGLQLLQAGIGSVTSGIGASITYYLTKQRKPLADLRAPLLVLLAALTLVTIGGIALWGIRFGFNPTLAMFAAAAPAVIVISWQQALLLGLNQVKSLNVQSLGLALGILVTVAAAVADHLGVIGAMWAWVICMYAGALVVVGRAVTASEGTSTWPFGEALRSLVSFGSRSGLYGVLGFFNYRTDSLVLIAYLGASGFGVYSVAVSAGELMFRISRSIATATTHRVSSTNLKTSAETTAKAIRISTAGVLAGSLLLFVLAPWLIEFLYGPRFAQAAGALRVLLPGIVAFSAAGLFAPFFAFQLGRPMFLVYLSLLMIAVQTGACVWLIPMLGPSGAAAGSTATYLVAGVFSTWYFCKKTGLRPADVWIARREDLTSLLKLVQRGGASRPPTSAR